MSYFWSKVDGLNADIERHTKEQVRLEKKILECEESLNQNQADAFAMRSLLSYKNLLNLLLDSKAQLAIKSTLTLASLISL